MEIFQNTEKAPDAKKKKKKSLIYDRKNLQIAKYPMMGMFK